VTTTTTQAAVRTPFNNWNLAGLYIMPSFGIGWLLRRKRRLSVLCGLVLAMAWVITGVSGCSGSGNGGSTAPTNYRTPSGNYTLTITATSGSVTTTQNLTLFVN
jgi:hypothetical protein